MARSVSQADLPVANEVYETLFQYTPKGVVPWLAEKADVSADGLTWRLTLRSGVKFHDDTDLDAAAVKYNFDIRKTTPTFRGNANLAELREINVLDDRTVQFLLSQPKASFREVLSFLIFGMQSPTAMTKYPDPVEYARHAAGTGPFKFESMEGDQKITLVRNEQYWDRKPYLDRIVFRRIDDDASRVAALESGDVHFAAVPAAEYQRLLSEDRLNLYPQAASDLVLHILFNMAHGPTADKRVRQAIVLGMNRQSYLSVFYGLADLGDSHVPPKRAGYAKQTLYPYDAARAKQLLAAAGIERGTPLEILNQNPTQIPLSQLMKQDLDQLGFTTTIKTPDLTGWFAQLTTKVEDSKWQVSMAGLQDLYPDAEATLLRIFPSTAQPPRGNNWMHYTNLRVDALLVQQGAATDSNARNRLLAELQQILWDELPTYPLLLTRNVHASSKSLHDVTDATEGSQYWRFPRAWLGT
jgi:ABC-type transport system substrate-binding protein